jgi:hypothetical protein
VRFLAVLAVLSPLLVSACSLRRDGNFAGGGEIDARAGDVDASRDRDAGDRDARPSDFDAGPPVCTPACTGGEVCTARGCECPTGMCCPACGAGQMCDGADNCVPLPCGAAGQPCCGGTTCNMGATCASGSCVDSGCGGMGEMCCAGGGCDSGLACDDRFLIGSYRCVACGGSGDLCCPMRTCDNADLACNITRQCQHCGNSGEPCCTTGPGCRDGSSCPAWGSC